MRLAAWEEEPREDRAKGEQTNMYWKGSLHGTSSSGNYIWRALNQDNGYEIY